MAKVQEQVFIVRFSRLVKEGNDLGPIVGQDAGFEENAEVLLRELVDAGVLIEVERVDD